VTRLRAATPDDAARIVRNVQEGFDGYVEIAPAGWSPPEEDTPANVLRIRGELDLPSTFVRIAEVDGAFAGHVMVVAGERASRDGAVPDHHFRHLFVLEPYWGSGVARELHTAAIAFMTGTARLYVLAAHGRARRFYEREGWSLHDGPYFEERLDLEIAEYRRDETPTSA
jgi:GNAT superfamily N-acetyltransferase